VAIPEKGSPVFQLRENVTASLALLSDERAIVPLIEALKGKPDL
jgi:HEAT repeat protein